MRVTAAPGEMPDLARDEGMCLYALGRLQDAGEALNDYMQQLPGAPDAAVVQALLMGIRERGAATVAAAGGDGGAGDDGEDGASGLDSDGSSSSSKSRL